jgi:hypothetical protein
MVSRMGATGRPRSNAVGVCRARASYQRAQQRRRQRAIGLKNAVEGQKDRLFKVDNKSLIHSVLNWLQDDEQGDLGCQRWSSR